MLGLRITWSCCFSCVILLVAAPALATPEPAPPSEQPVPPTAAEAEKAEEANQAAQEAVPDAEDLDAAENLSDHPLPPPAELPASASNGTSAPIRYVLEGVRVRGNTTRTDVITHFVPLQPGEQFDVDDPSIEAIQWRLLGTGWFEEVKLSLARGSQRGWVILMIDVRERNTLVIDRLVLGLASTVTSSRSNADVVRPYAGLGLVENNLFGLGIAVRGAGVLATQSDGVSQYGLDFGYLDPMLRGTGFSLTGRVFHNYAREFFGRNPLVAIECPSPAPGESAEDCDPDVEGKRAVVIYHRTGFGFGTGHDISGQLRYTLDWLGEYVDVTDKPRAASTQRGREIVPIDFRIEDGTSFVSSLRLGLIYDRRDHPALTTRGTMANFYARVASAALGSSYDFARFEASVRHWVPLPWNHVVSFGLFVGTVFGDAPFFYDFYAADLSDLLPSRVLELNVDRRRTLNLLGTSIVEMDMEDLGARLDFEYQLEIYRGPGVIHGIDAYAGAGIFLLASRRDLRVAISGYEGWSRLPVDLTFDLGLQMDTEIGVFKLGFSSLIGFSHLGQENP
ncbi:MAG TPA: BamA/TamA family outer membrane protein [Polyangiales bacterium]|nr:BamA/TamA family outer membrane protein [Polyangiales bacterium]